MSWHCYMAEFCRMTQFCFDSFQNAGHRHTMEKMLLRCAWSPDQKMVTAGSGDSFVYIWDVATTKLVYKLPGHSGSVNEVAFHPTEPIIGSASSDKKVGSVSLIFAVGCAGSEKGTPCKITLSQPLCAFLFLATDRFTWASCENIPVSAERELRSKEGAGDNLKPLFARWNPKLYR